MMSCGKSGLAATLMGIAVYACLSRWPVSDPHTGVFIMTVRLLVLVVIGVVIYFGAAWALGCREVKSVRSILLRKLQGKGRAPGKQ